MLDLIYCIYILVLFLFLCNNVFYLFFMILKVSSFRFFLSRSSRTSFCICLCFILIFLLLLFFCLCLIVCFLCMVI